MPGPSLPPATSAAMGEVLAGVADELRRLGEMGERLQDTLSPLLLSSPAVMAEAQALDRIVQYAQDLAVFIGHCGQACAPDWSVDPAAAVADLRLSELAGRLGRPAQPADPASTLAEDDLADAGDLELW